MRMSVIQFILAALLSAQIFNLNAQAEPRRFRSVERFEVLDSLEYELLSIVIRDRIASRHFHRDSIRIVFRRVAGIELTADDIFRDKLYKRIIVAAGNGLCCMEGLKKETFDNFVEQNFKDNLVAEYFDLPLQYRVLDSKEDILLDHSDSAFEAIMFSDSVVTTLAVRVSRVGLDSKRKQALLHIEEMWGPPGGNACFYLLEREETGWVLKGSCMHWIS